MELLMQLYRRMLRCAAREGRGEGERGGRLEEIEMERGGKGGRQTERKRERYIERWERKRLREREREGNTEREVGERG